MSPCWDMSLCCARMLVHFGTERVTCFDIGQYHPFQINVRESEHFQASGRQDPQRTPSAGKRARDAKNPAGYGPTPLFWGGGLWTQFSPEPLLHAGECVHSVSPQAPEGESTARFRRENAPDRWERSCLQKGVRAKEHQRKVSPKW